MPFIIEHSTKPLYRGWNSEGPTWETDIADAIQYHRRTDADAVHAEDLDAGYIREVEDGEIVPEGPFQVMKVQGAAGWALARIDEQQKHVLMLLTMNEGFVNADEAEVAARICANALNRAMPIIIRMQKQHDAFIASLMRQVDSGAVILDTTAPDKVELTVHNIVQEIVSDDPAEVLRLFYEFVAHNVTQWKLGAGVPSHPIWAMTAKAMGNAVPITEGAEWAFIQPENRQTLDALKSGAEAD